jgi:hypothetical protein
LATTTTARAAPETARGRLSVTLGPEKRLLVKSPAEVHGRVERRTAMSSPSGRRPARPVCATKPVGSGTAGTGRSFQIPPVNYRGLLSSCSRQRRISDARKRR